MLGVGGIYPLPVAQAQLPPQPAAGVLALSALASGLAGEPLKSLAYQPLPLSWKPAAVSNLFNDSLPHSGQVVSGASLIFRRNSFWNPQALQRY